MASRALITTPGAVMGHGRPRDGVFAAVEPYPPGVEALLLHLLTCLKVISQCLGLRSSKLGRLPNFL